MFWVICKEIFLDYKVIWVIMVLVFSVGLVYVGVDYLCEVDRFWVGIIVEWEEGVVEL